MNSPFSTTATKHRAMLREVDAAKSEAADQFRFTRNRLEAVAAEIDIVLKGNESEAACDIVNELQELIGRAKRAEDEAGAW